MKAKYIYEEDHNLTLARWTSKGIQWTRKPYDLEEIKSTYIRKSSSIYEDLNELEYLSDFILPHNLHVTKSVPAGTDNIFLCSGEDNNTYIVNTDGFDYPRYISKLVLEEDLVNVHNEINEKLKLKGQTYDSLKTQNGNILVGEEGILGYQEILIPWSVIKKLMIKYDV